jgi:hypothetical protein
MALQSRNQRWRRAYLWLALWTLPSVIECAPLPFLR